MNDSFVGSHVAGYRIERLLGRGGMASVYFAWDTRNSRAVALKVLDERYRDTPSYVDRFVREARAITGWDNPHIVRVFDAGEENQIYYYAMEFVRGLDLAQLLRQYLDAGQLMPYEDVVRIAWAVADALDYAHTRGIIHRDVKPSNVLVSVDGRILLTDFGLVMDINRGTLGETFGSPAYIAPEQARNSANAVPQSDLYSLGVMLFEMLTGAVPFHDSSPTALALKHLTEEPPRPRNLNPRLSPGVEAVLLRALRKQPAERYATGYELMSALQHGLGEALTVTSAAPLPLPNETQILQTQRARRASPDQPAYPPAQPSNPNPPVVFPAARASAPSPLPGATAVAPAYQPQPGPPMRSYNPQAAGGSYGQRPGGMPPRGAPPAAPPAGKRAGGFSWGCLAALLAAGALAMVLGAVYAVNNSNFPLFPAPGVVTDPTATPTQEIPPTETAVPTLTETPTPEPSATLDPTPTETATLTPTFTATLPPPTATLAPTAAPTATPEPYFNLLLARQREDGFVLVNIGQTPMPLLPLVLRSVDDPERIYVNGEDWEVELLEPGQCVSAWVENARPRFPSGVRCEPVGEVLFFERDERFWTNQVEMHFNDQLVEVCLPDRERCEFDTRPLENP